MVFSRRARLAAGAAAAFLAPDAALAQISTDASLGRAAQALTGPRFTIPESLGSLRGPNLFHSFSVFNIASGQSATFTTSTRGIGNVVSRVTGGSASTINGALALVPADGAPNFFLINPVGVTFGAGASIDVPGAFHVSTADYVKFRDGVFHASPDAQSTLSSAPPEAFGFLGTQRATITVGGGARLSTALMQPFSIVAGDVTLDNGQATARAADIRIVALGGAAAEIAMAGPVSVAQGDLAIVNRGRISAPAVGAANAGNVTVAAGTVEMVDGGLISSSTSSTGNGGSVTLSAGNLFIDQRGGAITGIFSTADTGSSGHAGVIDVRVAGTLALREGAGISTGTLSSGNAGAVSVRARDISIEGEGRNTTGIASQAQTGSTGNAGSVLVDATSTLSVRDRGQISTSTFGAGAGGALTVRAGSVLVFNGARIASSAESAGNAGSIRIDAGTIVVDGNAGASGSTAIVSNAQSGGGNAGSIEINASESLSLVNGGAILSNTFTAGHGGAITINARNMLLDSMGHEENVTTVASNAYDAATGDAGTVSITVPGTLAVLNGGEISSSTFARGNARSVSVSAGNILIDAQDYTRWATGIFSIADSGTGNAGTVNVVASGDILVRNGGTIASGTFSAGQAGEVHVTARNLTIDGNGRYSSISSNSNPGATGNAGRVEIEVAERLSVFDEGFIGSSTFTSGNGGSVRVRARDILLDGRTPGNSVAISSQANEGTGNAGSLDVAASGSLVLLRNGVITSSTFSAGDAGSVDVSAGTMLMEGIPGSGLATGIVSNSYEGSGHAGPIRVTVAGLLEMRGQSEISTNTYTAGNAGSISIGAGSMSVDGGDDFAGVYSLALAGSTGNAGTISITVADSLALTRGADVNSSTLSSGNAGTVTVRAGRMLIDGGGQCPPCTGVFSQSEEGSTGRAGEIDVSVAGDLTIRDDGLINTSTRNAHDAGRIGVRAGTILIDGSFNITGIVSNAIDGTGNGGLVEVHAAGGLTVRDGGVIASTTYSAGNGGTMRVSANDMLLEGFSTLVGSNTERGSTGNGGIVDVRVAGLLDIREGALVSSASRGKGDAGSIVVRAHDIRIDGGDFARATGIVSEASDPSSQGDAGSIDVAATGDITVARFGVISSDSLSEGAAGSVRVSAHNIYLQGSVIGRDGIVSRARFLSTGAGTVDVNATETLRLTNGAEISSSSSAYRVPAGSVTVTARDIVVDGMSEFLWPSSIEARSTDSPGPGNVSVTASRSITVSNGGRLSVTNDDSRGSPSDRAPTLLTVSAPVVHLVSDGAITAAATGTRAASNIHVDVSSRMTLVNSAITTSAVDGDGGAITVVGDGVLALKDSQITTSVSGSRGNGGDISIGTSGLVMDTGFIRANTDAPDATGGNVAINVESLVPSGGSLFVGGRDPIEFRPGVFGLNVIQAAAPTGLSGAISITTPALDISGGLVGLSAKVLDTGGLGRSLCEMTGGSTLAQAGRGGMPPSSRDFARIEGSVTPVPQEKSAGSSRNLAWAGCR